MTFGKIVGNSLAVLMDRDVTQDDQAGRNCRAGVMQADAAALFAAETVAAGLALVRLAV